MLMRIFFLLSLLLSLAQVPLALALGEPLDPSQAFRFSARAIDAHTIEARWQIADEYYLYRDKFRFEVESEEVKLGPAQFPHGQSHDDENFGKVEIYRGGISIRLPVESASPGPFTLKARSQGCADMGVCYPPQTQEAQIEWSTQTRATTPRSASQEKPFFSLPTAPISMSQPPGPVSEAPAEADPKNSLSPKNTSPTRQTGDETSRIASLLKDATLGTSLLFFFGAGLALAFTPCMFPMLPILSGIIIGHGHDISKARAFVLSTAYVLGMSLCYAVLGIAAGLSGTLASSALQNAWFLGAGALIFTALALSMFGLYKLQMPSFLQSRLSDEANRQQGGSLHGAWLMGAISAAIVGPCVAAPLAGALLHIAKTGDALLGGTALFAMGLGMGFPLIIAGTSARHLLPRPGPWMNVVNRLFGVMLLGVALWLVSPLLPVMLQMLGWAALLIFPAIYLHALDPLPQRAHGWQRFGKGLGVLSLLMGAAMLIGALGGSRDPLQPLAFLRGGTSSTTEEPRFARVKTLAELEAQLKNPGRPIMLDFYADWCISCKEMERQTFADARIAPLMNRMKLLQVDVTQDTAEDRALLKHFDLFGPPGIIFFDAHGKERDDLRVIGFQPPEQFRPTLEEALRP